MPPLTVKQIGPTLFPGNGSVRRVKLLHFIPPRCILLSACLSHSSHPLYSYRRHVTSFALLRGPANETASSFLPVTSLKQLQWVCTAQAAAQSRLFIQSAFVPAGKVHAFYDLISCVCCVNLNNSPIHWCFNVFLFGFSIPSMKSKEEGATSVKKKNKLNKSMLKKRIFSHENTHSCLLFKICKFATA